MNNEHRGREVKAGCERECCQSWINRNALHRRCYEKSWNDFQKGGSSFGKDFRRSWKERKYQEKATRIEYVL